jgi:Fur family transcriptional regulator, ferric uptake regulator
VSLVRDDVWAQHAAASLATGGYRAGRARRAVVDVLAGMECCRSAAQIADQVRADGHRVGIASVYRALEVLTVRGLVARLDVGDGTARFERAQPDGEHHHHLVCARCGRVSSFEDPALERAIDGVADRLDYRVDAHDVVLRGTCPDCLRRATRSRDLAPAAAR